MKCDEVKNKLMDYLFAELNETERRQFDSHIKACRDCQTELKEFQKTVNIAEKWPEIEPERDIVFVSPKLNPVEKIARFFQANPQKPRLRRVGRLTFVGLILIVVFMRSEVHYSQGQFTLTIGSGDQSVELGDAPPGVVSALKSLQEESLMFTQQMVQASEQRQRELFVTGLNQIARKIDQTRTADLNYVGENLQRLHRDNLYNFDRLENLVKFSAIGYPGKK